MREERFLHKTLSSVMHKKRLTTLSLLTQAVLRNKKLSVTELGREIDLPIKERSAIRRSDRFIGNMNLHSERFPIFKKLADLMISNKRQPWIIVDWSEIPNSFNHVLRASLVAEGRALTLYEEVHPEKKLSNAKIQKDFLQKLKLLLPPDCKPVVITDAGFHNRWFREVLKLGWDYVGRIRSVKKYSDDNGLSWHNHTKLYSKATSTAKKIGEVLLCRTNPLSCYLYLHKSKAKGRSLL